MSDKSYEQFWNEISATLLAHYLHKTTSKTISNSESFHQTYLELFIKTHCYFGEFAFFHSLFINEQDKLKFTKNFLQYCDVIADLTINHTLFSKTQKLLENQEKRFQQEQHLTNLYPINDETSPEEIHSYLVAIKKLHEENKQNDKGIDKEFEGFFLKVIVITFKKFLEIYTKCQSPLKESFLVGFLAHFELNSWSMLNNLTPYEGEFNVENYSFDFIFQNDENNAKIAIKLDDNDYYEKRESQSITENINDRILIQKGWKILRFHQNEIEKNLSKTIHQISEIYKEISDGK